MEADVNMNISSFPSFFFSLKNHFTIYSNDKILWLEGDDSGAAWENLLNMSLSSPLTRLIHVVQQRSS